MALLQLEGIVAGYEREATVLHDVNMEVQEQQVVSIIGPNGAGKSTVLNAIFGFIPYRTGRVTFDGEDISDWTPARILRAGITFVPQGRNIFPEMTVLENLELGAYIRSDRKSIQRDIERVYESFPILRDRSNQMAGLLSGGQQQMLEMGRAMLLSPKLLLVDEPSMGLSPIMAKEVFAKLREIKATGTAVLMVEQNADASLDMSDYAYVLELGRNKQSGEAQAIRSDPEVRASYLGV